MLRITVKNESLTTTLKLEGKIMGPWVEELEKCWRGLKPLNGTLLWVDLDGVTFVDPNGEKLLKLMFLDGVEFRAAGVMTRHIVETIKRGRARDASG